MAHCRGQASHSLHGPRCRDGRLRVSQTWFAQCHGFDLNTKIRDLVVCAASRPPFARPLSSRPPGWPVRHAQRCQVQEGRLKKGGTQQARCRRTCRRRRCRPPCPPRPQRGRPAHTTQPTVTHRRGGGAPGGPPGGAEASPPRSHRWRRRRRSPRPPRLPTGPAGPTHRSQLTSRSGGGAAVVHPVRVELTRMHATHAA